MIHKRHQNLKEMLLGDIATKVMSGVVDERYVKRTKKKLCHCHSSHKINGQCLYGDQCETTGVIYKIRCTCCQAYYR